MKFMKFNWQSNWKLSIAILSVLFLTSLCNSNTSENYSTDLYPNNDVDPLVEYDYGNNSSSWHPDDHLDRPVVDYNYSNYGSD